MRNTPTILARTILLFGSAGLSMMVFAHGCEREEPAHIDSGESQMQEDEHQDHDHEEDHDVQDHDAGVHDGDAESSVIGIPSKVRQNLGVTFVKAERRPVHSTIRLPGQFELRPKARREYHAMLPGRVSLAVEQYQVVEKGQVLYELESPQWHQIQSNLAEVFQTCYCCLPELESAKAARAENAAQISFLEDRIEKLTAAGARDATLETDLMKLKAGVPRLDAEIKAKEADLQSALLRYDVLLSEASSLTGIDRKELDRRLPVESEGALAIPYWSSVRTIVVRAEAAGIVDHIGVTNAGWAETGSLILDTVDPKELRFHADAIQTDITRFENGQKGTVAPPPGGSISLQDTTVGHITVSFQAHPEQRTVPIYMIPEHLPPWAKPGVTAYLEVFLSGDEEGVTAVPEACVVRDGLEMVCFRRDPDNPDQAIRVHAELGVSDGRWVEVRSGIEPGDEIVLGGVYPLMLASSTSSERAAGGHFHGDGMFHEGEDH